MFLGERGPEIISALKHVVSRHKGSEQVGKDLKENIYKFALKAKIMGDEVRLTLEFRHGCLSHVVSKCFRISTAILRKGVRPDIISYSIHSLVRERLLCTWQCHNVCVR